MKLRTKGFTIIEVVVVLAIAGVIFGVIFWAMPNAQKSSNDSARRTIVANILSNLGEYQSNNNNALPADITAFNTDFVAEYFTQGITDPVTGTITPTAPGTDTDISDNALGTLWYAVNAACGTTAGTIQAGSGSRAVAVAMRLERGGGYCQDNT